MKKMCIRKHYAKVDPIALAISGATIYSAADLDKLRMRELLAIDAFKNRKATPADFRDLADLLNLTETFALSGIGPEALPVCEEAQAALLAAKEQFERTGAMSLSGGGLNAMRSVYEYQDLMRTSVDRSHYERIIQKTRNRIQSAHPSVKVLT